MGRFVDISSPLISDDPQILAPMGLSAAKVVSHAYFVDGVFYDSKGLVWQKNGSPSMFGKDAVAGLPAGAGSFTDSDYFSLGSGNDVLDFAGDFMMAIVFDGRNSTPFAMLASNGVGNTDGWVILNNATGNGVELAVYNSDGPKEMNPGPGLLVAGVPNILIAGMSGVNMIGSYNGSAVTSFATSGTRQPGTTRTMRLGRYENAGQAYTGGKIYEFWASSQAPTVDNVRQLMKAIQVKAGAS